MKVGIWEVSGRDACDCIVLNMMNWVGHIVIDFSGMMNEAGHSSLLQEYYELRRSQFVEFRLGKEGKGYIKASLSLKGLGQEHLSRIRTSFSYRFD